MGRIKHKNTGQVLNVAEGLSEDKMNLLFGNLNPGGNSEQPDPSHMGPSDNNNFSNNYSDQMSQQYADPENNAVICKEEI
jgi:hypothetical protein